MIKMSLDYNTIVNLLDVENPIYLIDEGKVVPVQEHIKGTRQLSLEHLIIHDYYDMDMMYFSLKNYNVTWSMDKKLLEEKVKNEKKERSLWK